VATATKAAEPHPRLRRLVSRDQFRDDVPDGRDERLEVGGVAVAGLFVVGLVLVGFVFWAGNVRTSVPAAGGYGDDPPEQLADAHVERGRYLTGDRKLLFYGAGIAVFGFAAMVVLGG
jgi:hypothetical protein